ncbi:hypothetical protein V2J09_017240 [Rumex salicifolius]
MSSFNSLHTFTLFITLYFAFSSMTCPDVEALVPANNTFKYTNQGEFGIYINEYDATYRVLPIFAHPFQLGFYNTTPNSYTLSLRMGVARSESDRKWIWEANRGNPVKKNASLTFGPDGNLMLADADGRIKWQTNTANKGVVGFDVLPNSNMVLYDAKGHYVWQSFDWPTNTLMVGQSLRLGKTTGLVSRSSLKHNTNGPYSLAMEPKRLALYYKDIKEPSPLVYYTSDRLVVGGSSSIKHVTLSCSPLDDDKSYYTLSLIYYGQDNKGIGSTHLAQTKSDCTLSYLRLEIDGNLRVYTYDDDVDSLAWSYPFTLFDRETTWPWETECQLPGRCGGFGLCEEDQCVGCPTETGIMGWSKKCHGPSIAACKPNKVGYFELKGVEHWMTKYNKGVGPMKKGDCASKCSKDESCLGYFYHGDVSMCWIARELNTLVRVPNSKHFGFIKTCKH